jgi:PAS domain S-box-containing protein
LTAALFFKSCLFRNKTELNFFIFVGYSVKDSALNNLQFIIPWGLLMVSLVISTLLFLWQRRRFSQLRQRYMDAKIMERRYTQLVHLLPQTVVELDKNGRIMFLNNAGKSLLEVEKFDLQQGVNIFDLIVPDDRGRFKSDFLYILEGGLNKGQEYIIQTPSAQRYSIRIYFSAISEQGEQIGIRGIIIDITKNKRLEREALSAVMETEERERKRFSEDLHDGLGPLLSTLKLYINQLNSGNNTEEESREQLRVINELIDEAISSTRNISNNILPGSIRDNGLWPAVEAFCSKLAQTGTMKFELDNNLDFKLRKNVESNIYRIIIELINNTIKHARASVIQIKLRTEADEIILTYSDNGIGIGNAAGEGMGLINIKNRSAALNGQYKFTDTNGMRFELKLLKNEIAET